MIANVGIHSDQCRSCAIVFVLWLVASHFDLDVLMTSLLVHSQTPGL